MFVNYRVSIGPHEKFVNYADDTTIFLTRSVAGDLNDDGNLILLKLYAWTQKNCLKINVAKTNAVLFRDRNKTAIINRTISLRSTALEIVPSIKSLGVIFHKKLSSESHVSSLSAKLWQVVG